MVGEKYHVSKTTSTYYGIDLNLIGGVFTLPFEKHWFIPCDSPDSDKSSDSSFSSSDGAADLVPEEVLLKSTADLWNSYIKLPEFHPSEFSEVSASIHHIQGWLAIRLNSMSAKSPFSLKSPK